jgi:hypothetical protein
LQHDGEVLAQRGQIVLAQVDAVEQNLPGGHVVEAHHQAGERGFAGAGVAHDGHRLPGSTVKETSLRIHSMPGMAGRFSLRGRGLRG